MSQRWWARGEGATAGDQTSAAYNLRTAYFSKLWYQSVGERGCGILIAFQSSFIYLHKVGTDRFLYFVHRITARFPNSKGFLDLTIKTKCYRNSPELLILVTNKFSVDS